MKVRNSGCVLADETSWRENGQNHWLWSFSTSETRYFVENKSRGHLIPKEVLGSEWTGVLLSDFYSAYSFYLGEHQRCWVHYLRDLKALQDKHPNDKSLMKWINRVHKVYRDAKEYATSHELGYKQDRVRARARSRFQAKLIALAEPYIDLEVPQRTLSKRIMRFANEMFTFIQHPHVPSDNNGAERAIRPAVIYRKVTGGTRSQVGSTTTAVLLSLVGTWNLRGQDTLKACAEMLRSTAPKNISHQV